MHPQQKKTNPALTGTNTGRWVMVQAGSLTPHEDGGVGIQGLSKHSILRLKNRKNRLETHEGMRRGRQHTCVQQQQETLNTDSR